MKIKTSRPLILCFLFLAAIAAGRADTETIVCLRHGERAGPELGQLQMRGLNRALALPPVLLKRFGTPQFIFAPDPARNVISGHKGAPAYDYIRPLMTIEPTAISCGLPVNTSFGYREIAGLEGELLKPAYQNAMVFVCWEHAWEEKFVVKILKDLGAEAAAASVPTWTGEDFDSLYIVHIDRTAGKTTATFTLEHEGISNLSNRLPSPAGP